MLAKIRQLSKEQRYMISTFVLAMFASFLMGYAIFRYEKLELCKSPIKIIEAQGVSVGKY